MSVTMKDIALRAGVSRSAVSAVINGTTASRVSAEKRKRILDICREVNYRRNFAATALKERKTGLLGFISNNLHDHFFAELTMAMSETVEAQGYELMLAVMPDDNKFDMKYFDRLLKDMCDGVFMCRDVRRVEQEVMRHINASHTPFVFLESGGDDTSFVKYDKLLGMELAFDEFIAKGHRRIAYANRAQDQEKLNAYRRCCERYGIEEQVYEFPLEAGTDEVFEFGRKIAQNRHLYTALIVTEYNIELMVGGFDAEGARIPDDLSIIAFNDTQRSQIFRPPLTSISLDVRTLSRYAMDIMSSQIGQFRPERIKNVFIPPQLIKRQSVKNIN